MDSRPRRRGGPDGRRAVRLRPRPRLGIAVQIAGERCGRRLPAVRLRDPDPTAVSERWFHRVYRGLDVSPTTGHVVGWVPFGPGSAYWALTSVRRDRLRRLRTPLYGYLAAVDLFVWNCDVLCADAH